MLTFYLIHFCIHGICVSDLGHFYYHEGNEGQPGLYFPCSLPLPIPQLYFPVFSDGTNSATSPLSSQGSHGSFISSAQQILRKAMNHKTIE